MEFDETSILLLLAIIALTLLSISFQPRTPDVHPIFLRSQSEASKVRHEGESAVYRSSLGSLRTRMYGQGKGEITTLVDIWNDGVLHHGRINDLTLGSRALANFDDEIKAFGRGLLSLGLQRGACVAILSKNSSHCFMSEISVMSAGLVSFIVPPRLEASLGQNSEALKMLVVQAVLLDNEHLSSQTILRDMGIKHIICLDGEPAINDNCHGRNSIIERGRVVLPPLLPEPSDTACMVMTQFGELGFASLTHRNILASISALSVNLGPAKKLSSTDVYLTTLPLSDVAARSGLYAAILNGAEICIGRGSPASLLSDCLNFRPTVLQTIGEAMASFNDLIQSLPKGYLFDFAIRRKLAILMKGCAVRDSFWDISFLSHVSRMLGGRVRLVQISEGSIDRDTLKSLVAVLGCQIVRSYTRNEAAGAITMTHPGDYLGFDEYSEDDVHHGSPIAGAEIKLRSIVKDGKNSMEGIEEGADPIGEIMVRGEMVASKYITPGGIGTGLDAEGWLSTGDMGQILVNGTLKVMDGS